MTVRKRGSSVAGMSEMSEMSGMIRVMGMSEQRKNRLAEFIQIAAEDKGVPYNEYVILNDNLDVLVNNLLFEEVLSSISYEELIAPDIGLTTDAAKMLKILFPSPAEGCLQFGGAMFEREIMKMETRTDSNSEMLEQLEHRIKSHKQELEDRREGRHLKTE